MTSTLVVDGGSPLVGDIEVRGAKNLVSKAMVAVVLAEEPCRLRGVPEISDVQVVSGLLELHGVLIDSTDRDGELVMDPTNVEQAHIADIDTHAGSSRVPVLLCGPLLHRLGEAFIPDLGGCRIGERPINYHLDVLREFGAVIEKRKDGLRLTAPHGLHGADVHLPYPSVGATEQVLLTAVRARGITTLRNAAIEPEIMDLIADPAEDGRDHLGADRPGHHHRGRRPARRLRPPGHPRPDRGGVVGLRRAGHERRHLRARRPAAADDAVPQRVPPHRRGLRRRRRGHPVLAPGRRAARHRPRDRRAPGLHDRLAAAPGRGADPDHRAVDRARDGLREPARLHRRAARLRRADPDLPRVPGRVTVPVRPGQLPALGGHLGPDARCGPPRSPCPTCAVASAT